MVLTSMVSLINSSEFRGVRYFYLFLVPGLSLVESSQLVDSRWDVKIRNFKLYLELYYLAYSLSLFQK